MPHRRRRPRVPVALSVAAALGLALSACASATTASIGSQSPAPSSAAGTAYFAAGTSSAAPTTSGTAAEIAGDEAAAQAQDDAATRIALNRAVAEDGIPYAELDPSLTHVPDGASILWEGLAVGAQSLRVDAHAGEEYTVLLLCAEQDGSRRSLVMATVPGEDFSDVMAESPGCGHWSAGLPAREADGPLTLTGVVPDGGPFRMVVYRSEG
ncbi:hypothetical protein NWP10_07350 [Micrococcus sp. HG099]|uniref:hypothetical protein n=1 Tax=Micrococcus sp. HG099 TaxID=2969755 RepID=UPI00215B33E3|nr:hypothetical protein [Micrococcus sp. HG099]MCR8675618.1 hypothetical protein [Micrococcus sp. HG099]